MHYFFPLCLKELFQFSGSLRLSASGTADKYYYRHLRLFKLTVKLRLAQRNFSISFNICETSLKIQAILTFWSRITMAFDLQNESDVKDYIEKLGIEYRFGCYSEKKPEGENLQKFHNFFWKIHERKSCSSVCHLLGDYLESIKKDFEKASKVYRSNCDDYGYGKSCLKFGHYSFLGKGKFNEIVALITG